MVEGHTNHEIAGGCDSREMVRLRSKQRASEQQLVDHDLVARSLVLSALSDHLHKDGGIGLNRRANHRIDVPEAAAFRWLLNKSTFAMVLHSGASIEPRADCWVLSARSCRTLATCPTAHAATL